MRCKLHLWWYFWLESGLTILTKLGGCDSNTHFQTNQILHELSSELQIAELGDQGGGGKKQGGEQQREKKWRRIPACLLAVPFPIILWRWPVPSSFLHPLINPPLIAFARTFPVLPCLPSHCYNKDLASLFFAFRLSQRLRLPPAVHFLNLKIFGKFYNGIQIQSREKSCQIKLIYYFCPEMPSILVYPRTWFIF